MKILFWIPAFVGTTIILSSCSTEFNPATGRQETLMYGDDKEAAIGASVALQVEKTMKFNNDVDINARVEGILHKIAAVSDRRDMVYAIRVIEDEDDVANAFSLPGGYVYVYKGLIDLVASDDQLASVIAHEVAHVTAKHAMKRLQGAYGAMILQGGAIASGNYALAAGIDLAASSILMKNSRADEYEADALGVKYMRLAGYDPSQMKVMLAKLLEHQAKEPLRPLNYWRTHPYLPQRIAMASQIAAGKADFRDYLNMTGEEH